MVLYIFYQHVIAQQDKVTDKITLILLTLYIFEIVIFFIFCLYLLKDTYVVVSEKFIKNDLIT